MLHSCHENQRMRYETSFTRLRHNDGASAALRGALVLYAHESQVNRTAAGG